MGKSVLIMSTPKGCFACPFHMADFNFNLCLATRNDSIRTISKVSHEGFKKLAGRPDWCPLKELPEKSTIENDMTDYQYGMVDGRNQCIDEITGGGNSND